MMMNQTFVEEFHEAEVSADLYHGENDSECAQPPRRSHRANAGAIPKRYGDFVVGVAEIEERDSNSYTEAM